MTNIIELNTDKNLSAEQLLEKWLRLERSGELGDIILVSCRATDDGEGFRVASSGTMKNKDLYWNLNAAAHIVMHT